MYRSIEIITSDDFKLNVKLFESKTDIRGTLIITSAMAVPARIYEKFASYMAERGFSVATFDYRGVETNNNNNNDASISDWATKDIPAVIDYLSTLHPNVYYMGHSIGGLMLGLLPNTDKLSKACLVACSTGTWWSDKNLKSSLLTGFIMNFYVPISNRVFGFTNAKAIKMGVNIPKTASSEWALWCRSKGFIGDHKSKYPTESYSKIDLETLNILIYDDDLATKSANSKLKDIYSKLKFIDHTVESEWPIGHLGLFRDKNKSEWERIFSWLKG